LLTFVRDYFDRLNRSFVACYRLLERPRTARNAVVALLTIHSSLLAYSAYVHSPTLNEPGHLVAGLSIWKFGRFDVYNVNPPLVKMVAALPVIAAGYEEDWSRFRIGPGVRSEFAMGEDFVAANRERSFLLFTMARWACIPFAWLGAIVCYLWSRDLFGRPSGVLACAIWCFEPNILAHSSLISPDAHAAALGLAACYTFWRWLKKPSWSQAAITGIVLGLAELAKSTLILFYPLWPVMWVVYRLMERRAGGVPRGPALFGESSHWLREGGMLATRMAIGLYVLNLGYAFEDSMQPLREFHFVSDLFTGHASDDIYFNTKVAAFSPGQSVVARGANISSGNLSRSRPVSGFNRVADTWLGSVPSVFPKNYLLGIDLQQRDFEHYGRPSYLRGQWRDHGWWYYYLYACAIKVPLGIWVLGALSSIAVIFFLSQRERRRKRPISNLCSKSSCVSICSCDSSLRDHLVLLIPPAMMFIVASMKMNINEHIRYVLPSFPFAIIAVSGFFTNFLDLDGRTNIDWRRSKLPRGICHMAVVAIVWAFVSSLWIYPHSLSYFNELVGGPTQGSDHLIRSNIDWGQDLKYLKWWHEGVRSSQPLRVTCEIFASPVSLGLDCDWNREVLGDALRAPNVQTHLHAVSLNRLRENDMRPQASLVILPADSIRRSICLTRVARIGYSMIVYEIRPE
jgi:hypothetical protein